MLQKKKLLVLLSLLFANCSNYESISGIYICSTLKDSAKYSNSYCFYQRIEFVNSSKAIITNKMGDTINSEVVRGDSNLVVIVHPKFSSESLILTINKKENTLQGRGYKFTKLK
jgi:hypothetical protein